MLNPKHVEPEGQQKLGGIWPHCWKFETLQELAALGKRPVTSTASNAVEGAAADEGEENKRQKAVSSRNFARAIFEYVLVRMERELSENFRQWQSGGAYKAEEKERAVDQEAV